MKEITTSELRSLQLNMLKDFASFCDKNNYTYFLGGGTLLGAIRHKGYIPWDDDIDLMMPRPDYELAFRNYKNPYIKIVNYTSNTEYSGEWAVLSDNRTVRVGDIKESGTVYIDIFPIDGIPSSSWKRKCLFFLKSALFYLKLSSVKKYGTTGRYMDRDAGWLNWKKHVRTSIKGLMITIFGHTNPKFWARLLDQLARHYDYNKTELAGAVLGCNGLREVMPKSIYKEKIRVPFEDGEYWSPKDYDRYLSSLYGDYMTPPPKDKQAAHHLYTFYWKDGVEK